MNEEDIKKQLEVKNKEIYLNKLNLDLDNNLEVLVLTIDNLLKIQSEELQKKIIEIAESFQDEKVFKQKITEFMNSYNDYLMNLFEQKKIKLKENLEIEYLTECNNKENYLNLLKQRRELDIIKGFTPKGVHRDDFVIYINEKNVSVFGSQGQNRTAVLSLKLSELQIIYDEINDFPILLLDDFMSELDEKRRESLLTRIQDTQVIITCTEKFKLENIESKVYNVIQGKINY